MRTLTLTLGFALLGTVTAKAHWPLTYVGSSAIHRVDGPVHQVMLLQTPAEAEKARADEREARNSECAIEVGTFLTEPASVGQLFSEKLLPSEDIEPKYEARSLQRRENDGFPHPYVAPQFIDVNGV